MTRVLIAHQVDAETQYTADGAALIVGRTVEEVRVYFNPLKDACGLPPEWIRDGRRRLREAQAKTSASGLIGSLLALHLWAEEQGATIDPDEESQQIWMITPTDSTEGNKHD